MTRGDAGGVRAAAEHIRGHKQEIADEWARVVRADLEPLNGLDRGALFDHLPEVLEGLAAWIEGREADAEPAFVALADGHALQRLGFEIDLAVVGAEYARLRKVLLNRLFALGPFPDIPEAVIRLNEGFDRATQLATERYTERRDLHRDRFVGILGHDLRAPLHAAVMATELLLLSDSLGPRERERVLTISRATDRMTRLISDLLDFARGHLAGGIPASPAPCDMGEICRSLVEEAASTHVGRDIRLTASGDLRGAFDRERALQALGNLLSNAVHHGADPVSVAAWEADDRRAVFTRVTNRGGGIAPEVVSRLFQPFAHAHDRNRHSLGLGLFIVAEIARAHGGTCEVSSSDDQTSFTIRWPRTPLEEAPDRA